MKTFIALISCVLCLAAVFSATSVLAQDRSRDDNMLVDYPDGRYGVDMGGGFVSMPDGTVLPPPEYRSPLANSEYGPMTPTGFSVFPGSSFEKHEKAYEKKEQQQVNDAVFYEGQTTSRGALWGVSSPRPKQEGVPKETQSDNGY